MLLPAGWNSDGLVHLPDPNNTAFLSMGVLPVDDGQAVAWLGDAPRVEGRVFASAAQPADRTFALPRGGSVLVFDDGTFLVANQAKSVFPAPFRGMGSMPSTNVLDKLLDALQPWTGEWTGGARAGKLVPSFLPFQPVPSAQEEADLVAIAENLLAILRMADTSAHWRSQPVKRNGSISSPMLSTTPKAHPHWHLLHTALQLLWLGGYPIPTLPGQTLRDGSRQALHLDITAHTPPIASAHERLKVEMRPGVQDMRKVLHRFLEQEGLVP
jgi:hypothetical protein